MKQIVFSIHDADALARRLCDRLGAEYGIAEIRRFPDGESYVRVLSDLGGKHAVIVCNLHRPDEKFISLYFLARTLKEQAAFRITLVAPYLPYLRQDTRFKPGEALSSEYFARLLGSCVDGIVTIDPHLHRFANLSEVYSVETKVMRSAPLIAEHIKKHITHPVLIGPDEESEQWVSEVAARAGAPYIVLAKQRLGDEKVDISAPGLEKYKAHTPVLVDDIISTAQTMMETLGHLRRLGMKPAVCIGVHAVFAHNAFEALKKAGVQEVLTCNTIPHPSNKIDISSLLTEGLKGRL